MTDERVDNEPGGAMPSILERLCLPDMKEQFLEHKSRKMSPRELEEMVSYINSDECTQDLQDLAAGKFDFPLPRQVMLRKSHSDRRRILFVYPRRQNILLMYIVWGMQEYDPIFSPQLYSFRKNKSVATLFSRVASMNYMRDLYTLKADVHDYGHSIRPEKLAPMIEEIVGPRDPKLLAFLEYLLFRGEYLRNGKVVKGDMGGLPGVPIGCFFNNVYLMELDREMERRSVLYSRYADDIAVFTRTREEAEEAGAVMGKIIDGLGISLNTDKTQLIEPGGDIELLGIQIRNGNLDVADNTLAKAKTKLTHYANKLIRYERFRGMPCDDAARAMARKIDRYFFGSDESLHQLCWRDFFFGVITRPDSLHEIDLLCQDLIRRVATGKRGDSRYRCRYKDIRAYGYRPLVHDYYRYIEERHKRWKSA